jgi:hypothetical protein
MPFPTTAVLDTFTRADGDVTTGSSWIVWPLINANLDIIGNQVGSNVGVEGSLYGVSHGPDLEVYATLTAVGGISLIWRQNTTTTIDTRYYLDVGLVGGTNNDTLSFGKAIAGSYTENIGGVINLGFDVAAGDKVGISMVGSNLSVQYNRASIGTWSEVATRSDTDITTGGYSGIYINDTVARVDDFGGGTITSATVRRTLFGSGLGPRLIH